MQKIEYYLFTGEEIQLLREKMGYRKRRLAYLLQISETQLNNLESDKKEITPALSKLFVEILKKHFNYDNGYSLDTFLRIALKK